MEIVHSGKRPSVQGEPQWFTGNVWRDEIAAGAEPSRVRLYRVSFDPGARTAWHTHPVGQVLHVVTGSGLVQIAGQPIREIHPGDTVTIAPGERHWHGAGPKTQMVHLALQEVDANGVGVAWMEKVTDEEYNAR